MFDQFKEIWSVDFEFHSPAGERQDSICMVAKEHRTSKVLRFWSDELAAVSEPPFDIGPDSLFVAYYASAELGCLLSLGWSMPARILDLFCEFRNLTNGLSTVCGAGLIGALAHFGIDGIDSAEKTELRDLAIRGGPFTDKERAALLEYCESDVQALDKLLPAMADGVDLPRALLRGRYMAAAARIEFNGTPIDAPTLTKMLDNWTAIQSRLVDAIDADYGVYVAADNNLNPQSSFGRAVLDAADDYNVDAGQLASACRELWQQERDHFRELSEAIKVARQSTGLTRRKIEGWENSGRDSATWPHLDTAARSLAIEYPILELGYVDSDGVDGADYAGELWSLLRNDPTRPVPRHDPTLLRKAAELVVDAGENLSGRRFNAKLFAEWLADAGIPWPRLASGALDLSDDAFRQMARQYPEVAPLRELRHTLSQMRLNSLAVGSDDRNRCLLSTFRARTGRNQPSNSKFIFGPSAWLRSLIQPGRDWAVAYVDWSQQEFGIAAALSGDAAMSEAYLSGDPYLAFAKQAGAVPDDATKKSHAKDRGVFKVLSLAVQYGMAEQSLAVKLGQPPAYAAELLRLHRETYPTFWNWSEAAVNHAMLHGWLQTVFGWRIHVGENVNARSLANFPMQGNGAEMLRLACCLATERGIRVCAPVHDALLVEAPTEEIEETVAATQAAMLEASRIVLNGFELRTDAEIVRYPDRYMDVDRGKKMWDEVMGILEGLETEAVPF